jgi:hypothetical protein
MGGGLVSIRQYYLATGEGNALFIGDAVTLGGSADADGVCPSIAKVTAGDANPILGVIMGFLPDKTYTTMYRAASTARYALVCDDPKAIYHIRDDGAATLTAANVGQNAVLIMTHTGSTTTGISKMELDTNSDAPDADASNQLIILGKADIPNNALGANAIWEVMLSNPVFGPAGGRLGI